MRWRLVRAIIALAQLGAQFRGDLAVRGDDVRTKGCDDAVIAAAAGRIRLVADLIGIEDERAVVTAPERDDAVALAGVELIPA
mgnify:CR=1 FL=1